MMLSPRSLGGCIIKLPPVQISADKRWLEMCPGDEIKKELVLDLGCNLE